MLYLTLTHWRWYEFPSTVVYHEIQCWYSVVGRLCTWLSLSSCGGRLEASQQIWVGPLVKLAPVALCSHAAVITVVICHLKHPNLSGWVFRWAKLHVVLKPSGICWTPRVLHDAVHFTPQDSESSALEALAVMRYINLRFTLHYILQPKQITFGKVDTIVYFLLICLIYHTWCTQHCKKENK